jgi:flagellar assembly factor FliW
MSIHGSLLGAYFSEQLIDAVQRTGTKSPKAEFKFGLNGFEQEKQFYMKEMQVTKKFYDAVNTVCPAFAIDRVR